MFPYVTPSYFYEEMDVFDLNKMISCMDPKAYAECFPRVAGEGGRSAMRKAESLGVIRRD